MLLLLTLCSTLTAVANGLSILEPSLRGNNSTQPKKQTLAMLGLLEGYFKPALTRRSSTSYINGDMPYTQKCVLEIFRNVLEQASENDILPDYNLELYYEDGEIPDNLIGQLFSEFQKSVDMNSSTKMVSPMFLSPNEGCGTNGLDYLTPLRKISDFLSMTSISGYICGLNVGYGNANFHSKQSPLSDELSEMVQFSKYQLIFIRHFQWKEVAVLAISTVFSIQKTNVWLKEFDRNGINVIDIQIGNEDQFVSMFTSIKQTRARILIVDLMDKDYPDCDKCSAIYCASYKAGIRGSEYVLLFTPVRCGYCISFKVYAICEAAIIIEQTRISFFFPFNLAKYNWEFPRLKESIQHQLSIDKLTRTMKSMGCQGVQQYGKLDPAKYEVAYPLAVLLFLLDSAEKTFRQRFNTSIFGEKNRTLVEDLITQITTEYGLKGSNGDIYSHANRSYLVTQREYGGYTLVPDVGVINITGFFAANSFKWSTINGKPPADLSTVAHYYVGAKQNKIAAWILTALAFVVVMLETIFSVRREQKRSPTVIHVEQRMILLVSCLLLVVASPMFSIGPIYFLQTAFYIGHFFTVTGLSLISAIIIPKIILFWHLVAQQKFIPRHCQWEYLIFKEQSRLKVKTTAAAIFTVSILYYVIWLVVDPAIQKLKTSDPQPDPLTNKYADVTFAVMESTYLNHWISIFLLINGLFLCLGSLIVARLRKMLKTTSSREMTAVLKTTISLTIIFVFAIVCTVGVQKSLDLSNFSVATWLIVYSLACFHLLLSTSKSKSTKTSFILFPQ